MRHPRSQSSLVLFSGEPLFNEMERRKAAAKQDVLLFKRDYLMEVNEEELIAALVGEYSLAVPNLHQDEMKQSFPRDVDVIAPGYVEGEDGVINTQGTQFRIEIPFDGDETLFYFQPEGLVLPHHLA